jgi:hypothetical protein
VNTHWRSGTDERLQVVTDAAHREPGYQLLSLDPAGPKLMGTTWTPPHAGTSAYEVPMSDPILNGLLYLRTSEGTIKAYDLRQD